MRAITRDMDISTKEIYMATVPFVGLQFLGLVLVMLIPELITWLPRTLLK
jgi:TRAP-type mannitol/chloroaromatic compound transport system permease large subunit